MSLSINNQPDRKKENLNQQFYDRFKGIMPSIAKLKKASHIGSFGTQIVAIFPMALAYLPFETPWINIPLACLCCFLFGVTIELGISTFLPSSVRQIVGREFYNGWFIAMFTAIFLFIVLPLLIASPTLSSMGGQTIGAMAVTDEVRPQTDSLKEQYTIQLQLLDSLAQSKKNELKAAVEKEEIPVKNKYAGLIQIQQNNYNKYNKYQKKTGKAWPRDNMLEAKNNIEALKAEMNDKLSPILSSHKTEILTINNQLNKQKEFYQANLNTKLTGIENDYTESKTASNFKKWIWSGIGIFLAAFFSFGTIISVVIMVIFEKGSGKAFEPESGKEESSNFLQNLMEDLSSKIADLLPAAKAVKPEPKRRTIGFNKSGKSETEKAVNIDLEITNESKSGKKSEKITAFSTKKRKPSSPKAEGTISKAESENRKLVQASKDKITAQKKAINNTKKVTQKEVSQDTGFSEKTVRKYWR